MTIADSREVKLNIWAKILCCLFLLLAALTLYLRGVHHIYINDDVSYQFVLGEHSISSPDNDYTNRVDSFEKLIESQYNHYFYSNGRAIVHTIVQLFTGFWGYEMYNVFIALLFPLAIILFVCYACPSDYRCNPLICGLAVIVFLYLYPSPEGAFFWVVYGLNYLYPMVLMLCFLLAYRKIWAGGVSRYLWQQVLLAVFGFIAGWSHEGFALPISVATFLSVILTICRHKQVDYKILILLLPFWIGTAFLVFSPANFSRLGSSMAVNILNGLDIYTHLRLMWISLGCIIMARLLVPDKFKIQFQNFRLVWMAWGVACVFGLFANTGKWSLAGAEFFSSIVMFSVLPLLFSRFNLSEKMANVSTVLLLILVGLHQSMIICASVRLESQQRVFIEEYKKSPDNFARIPDVSLSPMVSPYVLDWFKSPNLDYILFSIAVNNGDKPRKPIILGKKDWQAIYSPDDFFVEANKVKGYSEFYSGDIYYWIKSENVRDSIGFNYHYSPVNVADCPYLLLKLKALFTPTSFVETEKIDMDDLKNPSERHKGIMMLKKSSWRRVDSITCDSNMRLID